MLIVQVAKAAIKANIERMVGKSPDKTLQLVTRVDSLGVGVSAMCVAHCIAFPLLLALLPLWPFAELLHGWLHLVFAAVILPVSVVAMWKGFNLHATYWVPACIAIGAALILLAIVLGHAWYGHQGEIVLTLLGSGLLIFGHVQNSRMGRKCAPCESSCKVC